METWVWIVIAAVAAAAVLLLVAAWTRRKRRRDHLQDRFGPEYDRTVSSEGRRDAERHLRDVEREHEQLDIRPLTPAARDRYLEEWRQAEARFVNDPEIAARTAERVVHRVLEDRGYPTDVDVEGRAAHVAADHPDVVERYRHGQAMLDGNGDQRTENLRKAMIDFRAVFEELVVVEPETARR
jgi:FtsZ-interacting cell division protein ZipA